MCSVREDLSFARGSRFNVLTSDCKQWYWMWGQREGSCGALMDSRCSWQLLVWNKMMLYCWLICKSAAQERKLLFRTVERVWMWWKQHWLAKLIFILWIFGERTKNMIFYLKYQTVLNQDTFTENAQKTYFSKWSEFMIKRRTEHVKIMLNVLTLFLTPLADICCYKLILHLK